MSAWKGLEKNAFEKLPWPFRIP